MHCHQPIFPMYTQVSKYSFKRGKPNGRAVRETMTWEQSLEVLTQAESLISSLVTLMQ